MANVEIPGQIEAPEEEEHHHGVSRATFLAGSAALGAGLLTEPTNVLASIAEAKHPNKSELAQVTALLTHLDYRNREVWNPKDYHFGKASVQKGRIRPSLIHKDATSHELRIDAMQLENGSWVRGLHYMVPGHPDFGGFVIDAVLDTSTTKWGKEDPNGLAVDKPWRRVGLTDPHADPLTLYTNLKLALDHQNGSDSYANGYKQVPVRYALATTDSDPSTLKPSDKQTADLSEPVTFLWRTGKTRDENIPQNIPPDKYPFYISADVHIRGGFYVDPDTKQLTYANFPFSGPAGLNVTSWLADDMFKGLEVLSHMSADFVDGDGQGLKPYEGQYLDFLSSLLQTTGVKWKPGNTVIPEDQFFRINDQRTAYTYSMLRALPPLSKAA